jgi:hypothetical protein
MYDMTGETMDSYRVSISLFFYSLWLAIFQWCQIGQTDAETILGTSGWFAIKEELKSNFAFNLSYLSCNKFIVYYSYIRTFIMNTS